jgi:hypothetical protein
LPAKYKLRRKRSFAWPHDRKETGNHGSFLLDRLLKAIEDTAPGGKIRICEFATNIRHFSRAVASYWVNHVN